MRPVRLHEGRLRVDQVPVPVPGPGEALVRVHAAAITRDELTCPADRLPAIPSDELAGVTEGGEPVIADAATSRLVESSAFGAAVRQCSARLHEQVPRGQQALRKGGRAQ
jgi:NADPH:quinone reductase-like Zn-dependent oxidoreductase